MCLSIPAGGSSMVERSFFPPLLPRCGKSAKRLFHAELDHRDHVCRGAARPHCAHGLLPAEEHRRQVCRYAAAAPATGNVLHGNRSVGIWPALGSLHLNQDSKLMNLSLVPIFLHDFE